MAGSDWHKAGDETSCCADSHRVKTKMNGRFAPAREAIRLKIKAYNISANSLRSLAVCSCRPAFAPVPQI